jgi:hypothetical protein
MRVRGLEERVERLHRDSGPAARLPSQVVDAGHARGEPQPVDRRLEDVVIRHDPLGAELGDLAVLELDGEHPAPDPIARLEHDHREPRVVEVERGGQPCEARSHHRDVYRVTHGPTIDWLA